MNGDLQSKGDLPREVDAAARAASRAPRRSRRRLLLWFLGVPVIAAVTIGSVLGVVAWRLQNSIDHKISRFGDPFRNLPDAARPTKATGSTAPLDLLVFGSDSRISAGDPSQWEAGAERTDAIMLVHIPADRSGAYIISIPRDSWVAVPGHGNAKINSAFSWGGPALAVQTIEHLTGVKIDHMMVTDFTGFARITDLLGGVTITIPEKTHLGNTSRTINAGTYKMDGDTALAYVRERYSLPAGDFDRVKRQQNWIRAIMRSTASSGVQKDPQRLMSLVDAFATNVSTDNGFTIDEMRDLTLSLRHVGSGGAKFMTVPIKSTGWSPDGKQSIVTLDAQAAKSLWTAVADDTVSTWLARNTTAALGETVR
jgi:LCP family protein required for cell wall assembly